MNNVGCNLNRVIHTKWLEGVLCNNRNWSYILDVVTFFNFKIYVIIVFLRNHRRGRRKSRILTAHERLHFWGVKMWSDLECGFFCTNNKAFHCMSSSKITSVNDNFKIKIDVSEHFLNTFQWFYRIKYVTLGKRCTSLEGKERNILLKLA